MTGRRKSASKPARSKPAPQVLDRDGQAAPKVSMKRLREHTGQVLGQARRRGAIAITKNGKPVAVALAPDQFVILCVAYASAAIGRSRRE